MKRIYLVLVTLLFVSIGTASAQFSLTNKNFRSTEDETKDYIVIDVPNTPQNKLYQKTKMYLSTLYNNPDKVMSEVDNEQIVINALDSEEMGLIFRFDGPNIWLFSYSYTFNFKDNKIKFTPFFKSLKNTQDNSEISLVGTRILGCASGLFSRKGKCYKKKGQRLIEENVAEYVTALTNALNKKSEQNDNW